MANGLESERRGGCRTVERQDTGIALGLAPPSGVRLSLSEELVRPGLADPRFSAAVRFRAKARHHIIDDRLRGFVLGCVSRNDSVAVELRLSEDFRGVR